MVAQLPGQVGEEKMPDHRLAEQPSYLPSGAIMNYQLHYDRLINRARERTLDGYKERHHIIPRCIGGNDEKTNLVYLTAREHYVAHLLLAKIHDGKLWYAVKQMGAERKRTSSRLYEKSRIIHSRDASIRFKGENNPAKRLDVRIKMCKSQQANPVFLGKKRPDHALRMTGVNNPAYGKSEHAYGLIKLGKANKDKTLEEIHGEQKGSEIRAKMKTAQSGVNPIWARIPQICEFCGRNILGKGNLNQHIASKHKEK